MDVVLVAVGGAIGSVARYACTGLVDRALGGSFPWGTLLVNVVGSFVIGVAAALAVPEGRLFLPANTRLFLMFGICGGFTTFSSFSLQTLDLLRSGAVLRASINIAASLLLCIGAAALGHAAAAHVNGGARQIAQAAIEEDA